MLKLLHISDIHIGARLGKHSQNDDIRARLEYVAEYVSDNKIDAVIICGDVFDVYNPSSESEDIYYSFIDRLSAAGTAVIIIAGNHDNHERLAAPAAILRRHNIFVAGNTAGNEYAAVLTLDLNGKSVDFITVPYVPDAALTAGIEFDDENARSEAYSKNYAEIVRAAVECSPSSIKIALGHLFVKNCEAAGSERMIQCGNNYLVNFEDLPKNVSYYGFGHLHRCQKVFDNAWYSGSLIPISIDEGKYSKKMILVGIGEDGASKIEIIDLPKISEYLNIRGDFAEVAAKLGAVKNAYVSLIFECMLDLEKTDRISLIARENNIKIASINYEIKSGDEESGFFNENYRPGTVSELFEAFLRERDMLSPGIIKKFNEILEKVHSGEINEAEIAEDKKY